MSAIRISPPASGLVHGGKTVGKDLVTYEYEQVRRSSQLLLGEH